MDNTYILSGIVIMAIVTFSLRAIPFIFLSDKKEYKTLNYLSNVLPCAVMGMLVVYCLRDVNVLNVKSIVPSLIAIIVVSGSYLYKRQTLVSIVLGTITYMFLIQVVFK